MKVSLKIILIVCLFIVNSISAQSSNDSDSTHKIIELIQKKLESKDSLSLVIEFTNRHGGEYIVNSSLVISKDNITVKSHIKNMLNEKSENIYSYSKIEFDTELKRQLDILFKFNEKLILSGNFQEIKINYNKTIETYKSQKALALMDLFDTGGLKYKKN